MLDIVPTLSEPESLLVYLTCRRFPSTTITGFDNRLDGLRLIYATNAERKKLPNELHLTQEHASSLSSIP